MCSMFFDYKQQKIQSLKQLQQLMTTPNMKQAISLMQSPIMELQARILQELDQNPIIEVQEEATEETEEVENKDDDSNNEELTFDDNDLRILQHLDDEFYDHFSESEGFYAKRSQEEEKKKTYLEQSIPAKKTFSEHLMKQAKESFESDQDIEMAEAVIGNFNESGYLKTPLKEIALMNQFDESELERVLTTIQTFDPSGIGARNLKECLLIQLKRQNLQESLTYKIVINHFDDLLHNRIPEIQKGLKCSTIKINKAIDEKISHLDIHPGLKYSSAPTQHIVPDASLSYVEDNPKVLINDEYIPVINFNKRYMKMLKDQNLAPETKNYIRSKVFSARWLLKNIDQRNKTITRILEVLGKKQKAFFQDADGELTPLSMKALAQELELHESTIARACQDKYVDTPRGIVSLKSLFSGAYTTDQGLEISSKTVSEAVKKLIDNEDKKRPLSDAQLELALNRKGIPVARRTIAKYRGLMNVGNRSQRRVY